MPSALSQYRQVLDGARARLVRLTERAALGPLRRLYDEALADIERKLSLARRGTMGAAQLVALRRQAVEGIATISVRMGDHLATASHEAQVDSLHALTRDITTMQRDAGEELVAMPIEEASRFRGIIDGRRTSLLSAHASSVRRWGTNAIGSVERSLSIGLLAGDEGDELADRVLGAIDGERWQAERIARTECAWAYSATQADGMKAQREQLTDLMMRWNEHVSDGYQPLDDRVGVDSIAMHNQVVEPGGFFVMPPSSPGGELVSPGLIGQSWAHPPNRPNDRAVLTPWRKRWGTPGWIWTGGRRTFL